MYVYNTIHWHLPPIYWFQRKRKYIVAQLFETICLYVNFSGGRIWSGFKFVFLLIRSHFLECLHYTLRYSAHASEKGFAFLHVTLAISSLRRRWRTSQEYNTKWKNKQHKLPYFQFLHHRRHQCFLCLLAFSSWKVNDFYLRHVIRLAHVLHCTCSHKLRIQPLQTNYIE